jgi:sensor domain CHASE-containing protein
LSCAFADHDWYSFVNKRVYSTLQSKFFSERIATTFAKRVLLPAVLVTTLALVLGVFALYWAADRSNNISVERQLKSTERSIRAIVGELAQQQEMVAVWDDTVQEVSKPDLDEVWLDANIGGWLHKTLGQDQVFSLNPNNEPIDATVDGQRVAPHAYAAIATALQGIIAGLRGDPASGHMHHLENAKDNSYLTYGKAIYDAHLLQLANRPAAVSAMLIVPDSDRVTLPSGSESLLVTIRQAHHHR